MVRYAACAAAAKQLGHSSSIAASINKAAPSSLEVSVHRHNKETKDWLWHGAKYYGLAIQTMATELTQATSVFNDLTPSDTGIPWAAPFAGSPSGSGTGANTNEARLVAACIMCQYEELSASVVAWAGHLNGIHRLLRIHDFESSFASQGSVAAPSPTLQTPTSLQSLFWYFVQDDIEEACEYCRSLDIIALLSAIDISSRPTRINPRNVALWRSMGLAISDNGQIALEQMMVDTANNSAEEDAVGLREVLWLMCEVVTAISLKRRSHFPTGESPAKLLGRAQDRAAEWEALSEALQRWSQLLPSSFQPDVTRKSANQHQGNATPIFAEEVWYSNSTCAMASVYYHTASILLKIHEPSELLLRRCQQTSNAADWLAASRLLQRDVAQHAKGIVSIALALPEDALRMHMVQPLYVAGRCLATEQDQQMLVELLESIEKDLGLATGYRVKSLIAEWNSSVLRRQRCELDQELADLSSADER